MSVGTGAARPGEQGPVPPSQPHPVCGHHGPRKSKNPKNTLIPSYFHPSVLARNRLSEWHTPYSFHSISSLAARFPRSYKNGGTSSSRLSKRIPEGITGLGC